MKEAQERVTPVSLNIHLCIIQLLEEQLKHREDPEVCVYPNYFTYLVIKTYCGAHVIWSCKPEDKHLPYADAMASEGLALAEARNPLIYIDNIQLAANSGGIPWVLVRNTETGSETLIKTGYSPLHRILDTVLSLKEGDIVENVMLPNALSISALLRYVIIECALANKLRLYSDDESEPCLSLSVLEQYLSDICDLDGAVVQRILTQKGRYLNPSTLRDVCKGILLDLRNRVFSATDDCYKDVPKRGEISQLSGYLHSYVKECLIPREKESFREKRIKVADELLKFPPFPMSGRWQDTTHGGDYNVVVMSPHPDDDAIGMGVAMIELHKGPESITEMGGHKTHVMNVYCVSGSSAVKEENVMRENMLRDIVAIKKGEKVQEFDKSRDLMTAIRCCEATDCTRTFADSPTCHRAVTCEAQPSIIDTINCNIYNFTNPLDNTTNVHVHRMVRIRENWGLQEGGEHSLTTCFAELPFYNLSARRLRYPPGNNAVSYDEQCCRCLFDTLPNANRVVFLAGDLSDPHLAHMLSFKAMLSTIEHECSKKIVFASFCDTIRVPPLLPAAIARNEAHAILYRSAWSPSHVATCSAFLVYGERGHRMKDIATQRHVSQHHPGLFPAVEEFYDMGAITDKRLCNDLRTLGVIDSSLYCEGFEVGINE